MSYRRSNRRAAPGVIEAYAGAVPPQGALLCNGQTVQIASYPRLYRALQGRPDINATSTTFRVPDMRNRVPVGAGGDYGRGAAGGANSRTPTVTVNAHTLSVARSPSHKHKSGVIAHQQASPNAFAAYAAFGAEPGGETTYRANGVEGKESGYHYAVTETIGGSESHAHGATSSAVDVRQPYRAENFIIWT